MMRAIRSRLTVVAAFLAAALFATSASAERPLIVGVLKFGTVNWLIDTMLHHDLDVANGLKVEPLALASKNATSVALQSGAADVIVTDWIWVARQRAAGADFVFIPYSTALGALMTPAGSPIDGVDSLAGKRIGVAGGPLDKSWLLLRALAARKGVGDPAEMAEPVFAAPPLLNQQIESGNLDAVLTFWPYAARLEAQGFRRLLDVAEISRELGVEAPTPMVGFVFRQSVAAERADDFAGFARALRESNALLSSSDLEWGRLRPLMKARNDAEFVALREGFRDGIPGAWGDAERAAAARLFETLARIGGERLVGDAREFDPAIFWSPPGASDGDAAGDGS